MTNPTLKKGDRVLLKGHGEHDGVRMVGSPVTTDIDWEPSEEMLDMGILAIAHNSEEEDDIKLKAALIVARPLIIAEEKPKIEAAERERVLEEVALGFEISGWHETASRLRALKDKP